MKKKNKHVFPRKRKEIRFHSIKTKTKSGNKMKLMHPAYVFLKKGNVFIYVSITHSSKVENYILIELRKNPNPSDSEKSYYIADIKEDTIDNFGKEIEGWALDPEDDKDIRKLFYANKKDDSAA